MRRGWSDLDQARAGNQITVTGYPVAFAGQRQASRFLLTEEASCCPGCAPRDAGGTIEVLATHPVRVGAGAVQLTGHWRVLREPDGRPRYQLVDASADTPFGWGAVTRRKALAAGPLMCLAACATGVDPSAARAAIAASLTADLHSHAGGIANVTRMRSGQAFAPVAEKMRQGGMAVACLAIVSDGPTHKLMPDGRLHPYRIPDPGELYDYANLAFSRLHDMTRIQGLAIVTGAAGLRAASDGVPSAIIAAEGADFLEGQPDRVNEAYDKWALRHLQLTHYRVNELGDIQTEPPVHGGLTDTGAEVIRRCNKLGIVVDVAHGTFDLVKRAASVSSRPLVLSHTYLSDNPPRFSRRITSDHARVIAGTGGVIGVWPPAETFPTMAALAAGMARMVDVVGVDHVGLGSDMRGLVGPSIFPDYDALPDLAAALLGAGFNAADAGKILGGNYARVFAACVT
jgi:membrane dipeptidase